MESFSGCWINQNQLALLALSFAATEVMMLLFDDVFQMLVEVK